MNKKILFKSVLSLFLGSMVLFVSCHKDEPEIDNVIVNNIINAKVENGNNYNSTIDLIHGEGYNKYPIVSSDYINGGFTFVLPVTLANKYLKVLENIPDGLIFSDLQAETVYLDIFAYKSQKQVGSIVYATSGSQDEKKGVVSCFIYTDRDFTVTGSYLEVKDNFQHKNIYNLDLKKGWNVFFEKYNISGKDITHEFTSQLISGLKWYYIPIKPSGNPESLQRTSSIFVNHKSVSIFKSSNN